MRNTRGRVVQPLTVVERVFSPMTVLSGLSEVSTGFRQQTGYHFDRRRRWVVLGRSLHLQVLESGSFPGTVSRTLVVKVESGPCDLRLKSSINYLITLSSKLCPGHTRRRTSCYNEYRKVRDKEWWTDPGHPLFVRRRYSFHTPETLSINEPEFLEKYVDRKIYTSLNSLQSGMQQFASC